jgi:predicted Zn-dependent protease
VLVRNAPGLGANALSLPDGTIVVTDGLVRLAWNSSSQLTDTGKAQLVGVLGHEVGHLERRHAARALAGSSLTAALSAALFGDFSAVAAGVPALLSQMQYSRDMELEADDYAVAVLHRNGLSAGSLIQMLDKLERQNRRAASTPRWFRTTMSYVATHPATGERDRRLTAVMRQEDLDAAHAAGGNQANGG